MTGIELMSDRGNNVSNIHESMVGDRSGHDVVKLISGVGRAIQVNHAFRVRGSRTQAIACWDSAIRYITVQLMHTFCPLSPSLAIHHGPSRRTTSVHVAHNGVAEIADD